MLVASILSEITDGITSAIGDYGLYAVFLLGVVDAVLPAASEVVMLYAGAAAAGAFADQDVVFLGRTIDEGSLPMSQWLWQDDRARSARSWAGRRALRRPSVRRAPRPLAPSGHEKLDRAERWFERWGTYVFLVPAGRPSSARSSPFPRA